jgi:CBS domain-containing protein
MNTRQGRHDRRRSDETVGRAARLMFLHAVRRLPVTDARGHLAGIVTRSDVLSVYGRPDADIRADIMTGIVEGERHEDPGSYDVGVKDGVVTVTGRPLTHAQGHEIIRRMRYVEGVVDVHDRLTYPEGASGFDVLTAFPAD